MTYDNWQGRIERYDFVENKDYISFHKIMKRAVGGTNLLKNQDFVCVPQNCGTQKP